MSTIEQGLTYITRCESQANKLGILKDVSGIIKPSRSILNTPVPLAFSSYFFIDEGAIDPMEQHQLIGLISSITSHAG